MVLAVACGGSPAEPAGGQPEAAFADREAQRPQTGRTAVDTPAHTRCTGEASFSHPRGRYAPGDACHELDERWASLGDVERACTTDADCTRVSGPCFDAALSVRAARDPRWSRPPCSDPLGGECPEPDPGARAACYQGCCVVMPP